MADISSQVIEWGKNLKLEDMWGLLRTGGKLYAAYLCYKLGSAILWRRRMAKLYPCPPYGMMGNLADIEEFGGFSPEFIDAMHKKYGPIFGFFLGPFDYHLSISKPEHLQVVHTQATERPDGTFKAVNYLFRENVLFQHGAYQKAMRRSYQEIVNDPVVHNKLAQMANDALRKEIATWGNEPVNVLGRLGPLVYNVMGQVLFGKDWSSTGSGKIVMENHLFCVHDVMKWAFLPYAPIWNADYRKYANAKKALWTEVDKMLSQRRMELKNGVDLDNKDVYTLLLTSKKADGSLFYDRASAVSTMIVFMNGAYDTTLNSTVWTLYYLAKHQDCLKKLQAEVDKAFPDLKKGSPPNNAQIMELPYLEAVIREGMRVMPAGPINMRVNMDSDYEIPGLGVVPRNIPVILPYETAMKQQNIFGDDSAEFNPDRFAGDNAVVQQRKLLNTPFGGHTRMCVGRNFALVELRLFLATIVGTFDFELSDPTMKVKAKYEAGINVIDPPPGFKFKLR